MATLKLTLVKSTIGSTQKQLATAAALGLRRIGDSKEQPDNAATRGKIRILAHLLKVEGENT
ncbi:MAG: 50S ribosomal protein L30 [Oscillospiraceae bacterium]|jgi:large subunit ribosomal protein L30|nr:50S ribosomal protein L30 [Oscillospiraceae bacterium]